MFPKETKILIVDDMMTMRKIVKKSLLDLGLTNVTEANDGQTGWAEIEKSLVTNSPFQLIISDWNMPILKGIELLKKVRAHDKMGTVPFVLLTAEAEKDQIVEAIGLKVTAYITKPFTPAVFQEKMKIAFAASQKK